MGETASTYWGSKAISKKVITLCNTTHIPAETFIVFLPLLKKQNGDKPIQLVLDNARYQHFIAIIQAAVSLGVTLLFIEGPWKLQKRTSVCEV